MSNYPNELDDDVSLPRVDNNITQIGGDAINALRSAVFNIEDTLGINPAGTAGNLAAFLAVAHNPDGSIQPSVLTSLGLVVLPITDPQVSLTAGIKESKLALDYPTASLFSFIQQVNLGTQQSLNFITNHGSKIEPHIQGINFNHYMNAILVAPTTLNYFTNDQGLFRDNSNLYNLFNDLNTDYIKHQVANSTLVTFANGQQSGGTVPPSNYAHVADGIYLNTSTFSFIPETNTNLQLFAEFIDSSNILLLGTRIQTLYQNGIPRTSNSSSLLSQTQGPIVIPSTPVTTYLLAGSSTTPVDDINHGDDVIQFNPVSDDGYTFDALFSAVRVGDIITVNYGTFVVSNIVTEIKYIVSQDQSSHTFAIRIDGKNLQSSTIATATITRSLFNNEKFGVLALAQANNTFGVLPSLTVGAPSGAEVLSVNFDASLIDQTHYNLYIAVYPNGNPANGIFNAPAIDISGNQGTTPGVYNIDNVVQNINNKFRSPGFNNRLMAFSYQGELGIKLTDSINNISFSIIDGYLNPTTGFYNQTLSSTLFPFNAIGVPGFDPIDPSGLGPSGAAVSGPSYTASFASTFAAQTPTKIIAPLTRKTFYVNGSEEERFALQPLQSIDGYGDGYWSATILQKNIISGIRVELTYQVKLNLSTSGLKVGKTITVSPGNNSTATFVDSGRYIISAIQFIDCSECDTSNPASIIATNITVYDAIQSSSGITPSASAGVGAAVNLYFSSDSVGFNTESLSDATALPQSFKRFMEIYIDGNGNTFSHERARYYISNNVVPTTPFGYSYTGLIIGSPLSVVPLYGDASQQLILANVVNVSPKLRGFPYGTVDKINLQIKSYNSTTGSFDGYLCNFNLSNSPAVTNMGPVITSKKGEVTRFYDQTNVEYIDILFDVNDNVSSFVNAHIDIQLFPTLSLDQDVMLLGTALINNQVNTLNYLTDRRQFGNISEQQLSTSAISFIQTGSKYLHQNGVVRGFNIAGVSNDIISISGGLALVNGQFVQMNNSIITIPIVKEIYLATQYNINWLLCVNSNNEFVIIPLTDFDPVLATPNTPLGRVMTVTDLATATTYSIDSNTFTNILNYRKDLTPLYLVPSIVTGTGISAIATISAQDMRKYVVDENSITKPTLTDQATQGNFDSITSVINWFKYNSVYQNTLNVKSSYTFITDPGFSLNPIDVIGDGDNASFTFGGLTGTYSIINTNFTNMTLTFNLPTSISNGVISNSTIISNAAATISSMTFNDCNINIGVASSFTECVFNNCVITITAAVIVTVGNNCTFNNCEISNSLAMGTVFSILGSAANVSFIGCNVVYFSSTPAGYPSNLVNTGSGFIHSTVSLLENIKIDNCQFLATSSARFSFINFEYSSNSAIAQNIYITNNKFYNIDVIDDVQAVIAFVSTLTTSSSSEGLKLIDCLIANNFCDKDQMIIITGTPDSSFNINTTIVPVATRISGNSCGTIGIIGMADLDRVSSFNTATNTIGYDKNYNCVIEKNTCRFIGALQYNGIFAGGLQNSPSASTPYVNVNTCPVAVNDNTCHWIQMIASGLTDDSFNKNNVIKVTNNTLRAYDPNYLNNFSSSLTNAAIFIQFSDQINAGLFSETVIQSNSTNTGKYLTSSSTAIYNYDNCVSVSSANAIITENIFNNAAASATMILVGSAGSTPSFYTITNNQFYRNSVNIANYIATAFCQITITHNFFDSTTTNGTNENLVSFTLSRPIYRENTNQIAYASLDPNQFNWFSSTVPQGQVFAGTTINGWPIQLDGTLSGKIVNASLDSIIPRGTQLLFVVIGALFQTGGGSNNMAFSILQGTQGSGNVFSTTSPPAGFANSLADLNTNGGVFGPTYSSTTSGNPTPIVIVNNSSISSYAWLDTSSSFILSDNGSIQFFLTVNIAGSSTVLFSPVLVKYKW